MIILGVDPGLNATGFGILDAGAGRLRLIAAGDIRPPKTQPLPERLGCIHAALSELISRHHPETAVLEKIFTHHGHVTTAALMGHARGAACLAVRDCGVPLAEYPPTQVKKSVTGRGHASKDQVGRMVSTWLGIPNPGWSHDAADALALAIVHAHTASQNRRLPAGVTR